MRAHGTRTKYVWDKCRCLPCRVASTNYESARQAARRLPWRVRYAPPAKRWFVMHIDTNEIVWRGPHREEAYRERDRLNREARQEDPIWASPQKVAEVRRHLQFLKDQGVGLHRVADIARLSRTRLQEIRRGRAHRKGRPTNRRLKNTTAERILGVTASSAGSAACVPADHVWRLIDELRRAGWPKARIALALGRKTPALQLRKDRVIKRSADAVQALHDLAWRQDPQVRLACRCFGTVDDGRLERKRDNQRRSRSRRAAA